MKKNFQNTILIGQISILFYTQFEIAQNECKNLLNNDTPLPLPAYDECLKSSHIFNLLDARGAISVSERQGFILK